MDATDMLDFRPDNPNTGLIICTQGSPLCISHSGLHCEKVIMVKKKKSRPTSEIVTNATNLHIIGP